MKATSTFDLVNALKLAVAGTTAMLLLWSGAATAASMVASTAYSPGFWGGFGDGFLALLKLLVSPFYSVVLVDGSAEARLYDVGYYLGVLLFAAFAGLAASPAQPVVPQVVDQVHEPRVNRPVQLS